MRGPFEIFLDQWKVCDDQILSRWQLPLCLHTVELCRAPCRRKRVHKSTVRKFASCSCRGTVSSVIHKLIKAAKRRRSSCHWLSQMFSLRALAEHAHPIPIALSGCPCRSMTIQLQLSGCGRTEQIISFFSKCGVNAVVVSSLFALMATASKKFAFLKTTNKRQLLMTCAAPLTPF